jgi:hypothetical protein
MVGKRDLSQTKEILNCLSPFRENAQEFEKYSRHLIDDAFVYGRCAGLEVIMDGKVIAGGRQWTDEERMAIMRLRDAIDTVIKLAIKAGKLGFKLSSAEEEDLFKKLLNIFPQPDDAENCAEFIRQVFDVSLTYAPLKRQSHPYCATAVIWFGRLWEALTELLDITVYADRCREYYLAKREGIEVLAEA